MFMLLMALSMVGIRIRRLRVMMVMSLFPIPVRVLMR